MSNPYPRTDSGKTLLSELADRKTDPSYWLLVAGWIAEIEANSLDDACWQRFRQWEEHAAEKGSGMTKDQMLGALMFRNWWKAER